MRYTYTFLKPKFVFEISKRYWNYLANKSFKSMEYT